MQFQVSQLVLAQSVGSANFYFKRNLLDAAKERPFPPMRNAVSGRPRATRFQFKRLFIAEKLQLARWV